MELEREATSKFCCRNWNWLGYAWLNNLHLLERNRRRPASRLLKPVKILDKIMNVWSCLFEDMKLSYLKLQRNVSNCASSIFLNINNKTGSVRITYHWGAFVLPLLLWKGNGYYITWVCVFVAIGIQHAMGIHHIVICGVPRSGVFLHIISWRARISTKKNYWTQKCVLIFSITFVWYIFHSKKKGVKHNKKMCIGLHVKYSFSCPILMKLEFSGQIFEKSSNIKFHETPSSGSRVIPCCRTDGQTWQS